MALLYRAMPLGLRIFMIADEGCIGVGVELYCTCDVLTVYQKYRNTYIILVLKREGKDLS
jgi:hypothetical protein